MSGEPPHLRVTKTGIDPSKPWPSQGWAIVEWEPPDDDSPTYYTTQVETEDNQ